MNDEEHKEYINKKIDNTHQSNLGWHKFAGVSSTISIILPLLSEFEGVIGDNFIYAVGGTGAVSVFAVIMKIGRVFSAIPLIEEEHQEHLEKESENHMQMIKEKRQRRIDSDYLHDF